MAGPDNRQLPPMARISVAALRLSPRVYKALIDSGFQTFAHLLRPTQTQREALATRSSRQELIEIKRKARHFIRCYLAVKKILAAERKPEVIEETLSSTTLPRDTMIKYDQIDIDVLNLPDKTYNALRRYGIAHVGALLTMRRDEIAAIPHVDDSAAEKIVNALDSFAAGDEPFEHGTFLAEPAAPYRYDAPLTKLTLSRRMRKALEGAGIKSVFDLVQRSDAELAAIKHIGQWRVSGIRSAVEEYMRRRESPYSKDDAERLLSEDKPQYSAILPTLSHISIGDLLRLWLQDMLPPEHLFLVEQKYGLFEEAGTPHVRDKVSTERDRQDADALQQALTVLSRNLEPFTPLYDLIDTHLSQTGATLRSDALYALVDVNGMKLGTVREASLLALLADLKADWHFQEHEDGNCTVTLSQTPSPRIGQEQQLEKETQEISGSEVEVTQDTANLVAKQLTQNETRPDYNQIPLDALELSTRSYRALRRGRVKTVGELMALEQQQILSIENIGPSSEEEIREKLATFLNLPPESQWNNVPGAVTQKDRLVAPITALKVGRRAYRAASEVGARTVQDLLHVSDEALLAIPGVDNAIVAEIRRELTNFLGNDSTVTIAEIDERKTTEFRQQRWLTVGDSAVPEVLWQWFDRRLTQRQREVVERRHGLFDEAETLVEVGKDFKVSRERIRQLQASAILRLRRSLAPVSALIALAEKAIATGSGILTADEWIHLLNEEGYELGAIRPQGMLSLLADLTEGWKYHSQSGGALAEERFSRRTVEKTALRRAQEYKRDEVVGSGTTEHDDTGGGASDTSVQLSTSTEKKTHRPRTRRVAKSDLNARSVRAGRKELEIPIGSPFYAIETSLRQQLEQVDLIGALPIDEAQFETWCRVVRKHAKDDKLPMPKRIPPALFVTLMVFTARYSSEEARNFWQPYAQMVWGLQKASQSFQMRFRIRFKQAIAFLSDQYDLFFPQRSTGDLVRPVYRHAIIPAYLEREFVDWLKGRWREILETPEGFLIPQLRQERSLNYLSPTLRNFIQDADTAETAAALIRSMATASSLLAEGESLADIDELLAASPIEQSLWSELSQVYMEQTDAGERRRLSHRLEWVWNLEAGEMQIRVRNLYLPGDITPYQIVWVEEGFPAEEAVFADTYETLDPWRADGEWLIDEVALPPDGPLNGTLMVLGEDDSLLWQHSVPPLPEAPAQFFRLSQQEVYALPIASDRVQTGRYLVALQEGVRLARPDVEDLEASSTLTLPYLLSDRYQVAGFFEVDFPLTIMRQKAEVETLMPSGAMAGSEPPFIHGEHAVHGLSRRVPPLYRSDEIWLVIPGASERLLAQGAVELRPQKGKARRRLLKEMELEADDDGALWVPLRELLGSKAGGVYTVELRRGLQSLLQAPLQFSCIPGFEAIGPADRPSDAHVYTPNQPPTATLRGVEVGQIGNRDRLHVAEGMDGWIEVAWHDLRGGCRLPMLVNGQQVPLEWPVRRFFAWVEPAAEDNVFTWDILNEATLHAVGGEGADYFFVSVGDSARGRQLSLNRNGRARIPIQQDQLYDMLRHERGAEVQVFVSIFSERWPLFTLRRHPELKEVHVSHDSAQGAVVFETNLREPWPGDFLFQVQRLNNPSAEPHVLERVAQLEPRHLIPCKLEEGIYQFEVWDTGTQRALAKEIFGMGEVERSAFFTEAVRLLESLSRDTAHRLPRWLGGDMIRFLATEIQKSEEGRSNLAPEWLWQLALLQPGAYAGATNDELEALWAPLRHFRHVDDIDGWEQRHGLLPDWAVLPFQLELRFIPFGNSITVEPAVLSRKGRRGIGYCFLKMGEEHRYVYVTWKAHQGASVSVTLGLPGVAPDEVDYVELDALDMFPVYQCLQCGWLVDSKISPEVQNRHRHRFTKAQLEDVLNHPGEYRLLAEIIPKRRDDIRDYRLTPDYFIDRRKVLNLLHGSETESTVPHSDLHPLGREAYLYASACWVARYRHDAETAEALRELVGDTRRRKAFARLTNYLGENRWFDVGAWGATGRLLTALPLERDEPLLLLDCYTLLLALIARSRVHARHRTTSLRNVLGLHDPELAEMLHVLDRHCPELVAWAFTWVELFFTHAAG